MEPRPNRPRVSRSSSWRPFALLVLALGLVACGCGEGEETGGASAAGSLVAVREVELGRRVDADGTVVAPADSFAPGDTVRISLVVEGKVDRAVVTARWTREEGLLVDEQQAVFPLDGRRIVGFRLVDPEGLPPGEYRAAIHLGPDAVASEAFRVVAPDGGEARPNTESEEESR